LDGVNKMSKSLGNYIGINEPPEIIFAKLMSISDGLMWRYIELLSFESLDTIALWKSQVQAGENPRNIKVKFAQEIVARFHSQADAEKALEDFQTRAKGGIPEQVPEITINIETETVGVAQLLKMAGLAESTSEAMRAIQQGGVKLDSIKVEDKNLQLKRGITVVAQVGKRKFAKIEVK
jgi:tyrosyl-tRNA synthetase